MNLLEAPAVSPWSNPGIAYGNLLVAYPTKLGKFPHGGKLVPLLEQYVATGPSRKAICVVLGEVKELQDDANTRLALRPDLTRHLGALVTFGRDMSSEPSHYAVDMREHAKVDEGFVGAELFASFDTTIDLQWSLRPHALQAVRLELQQTQCTVRAMS